MSIKSKFEELEQEAIRKLASEDIKEGAEVLPELAYCFSIAGYTLEDWAEYREMLISKAELLSKSPQLLRLKLEVAEQDDRQRRNNAARNARASKTVN